MPDEVPSFLNALGDAYGLTVDDRYLAAWNGAFDHKRNVALFDGRRLIGTATAGLVDLTTPGPVVTPVVCTGNLTVARDVTTPGLALSIFRHQCRQHRAAGHGVLVFSVTKAMRAVHLRTGSAPATSYVPLTLTQRRLTTGQASALAETSLFDARLDDVHRGVAAGQPGMIVRDAAWMTTVRRISAIDRAPTVWVHGADGQVDGYVRWYRERSRGDRIVVEELATMRPDACRNLVRGLLAEYGLPVELRYWRVDDPIHWLLGPEIGRHRQPRQDALWVRIIDVPRALTGRRYVAAGTVTLEVDDPLLPEGAGRYELEVSPDGAVSCAPTVNTADVTLSVGALAAVYLGGTSVPTLIEAGVIRPSSRAVARTLAAMFAAARIPWSGSER